MTTLELQDRDRGYLAATIAVMVQRLKDEADQLERWAVEAERGSWSTQHVGVMRERASKIRADLIRSGMYDLIG